MRAVQLNAYGDPIENIEIVDIAEPGPLGPNEVLIAVEYAAVNPADLYLMRGWYAVKPELPSIVGNEGVGTVLAVGSEVANVKIGDRVAPPISSFTWRERMVVPSRGLVSLPPSADPKQLAMVAINPVTASLLLTEIKNLKHGDWVVQNAANSGVGRGVIAFARERGLKTVNIVRRPELIEELKNAGATAVVVDGPDVSSEIKAAVGDSELGFGLDCIGGPASGVLASVLSHGGTLVAYGGMGAAPITLSPGDVIYKALEVTGFFLGHPQHAELFPARIRQAGDLIAANKLNVRISAVYPLHAVKDAVAHVQKGGKVLLDIAGI